MPSPGAVRETAPRELVVTAFAQEALDVLELRATCIGFEVRHFGLDELEMPEHGLGAAQHEQLRALRVHDERVIATNVDVLAREQRRERAALQRDRARESHLRPNVPMFLERENRRRL